MEISGIKVYNTLLTGDKKITADDADKIKDEEVTTELKLLNKKAYNELILSQEYMICFQITEEDKKKSNKYGNARKMWMKYSGKFYPTTGDSNKRLHKKISRCKLVSKGLLSSIEDMSSIEDTFQPYIHSGTIRPTRSPYPQACSPSHETYQLSRVLDDSDWV